MPALLRVAGGRLLADLVHLQVRQEQPGEMRLVTCNVWAREGAWQKRHALVLRQLQVLRPQLLCLQEVVAWDDALAWAEGLGLQVLLADPGGSNLAVLGCLPVRSTALLTCGARSPAEAQQRRHAIVGLEGGARVACTHLSWRAEDGAVRRAQLAQLAAQLGEGPALICGDLNCAPTAPELQPLWEAGFADALVGTSAEGRCTWDTANPATAPYAAAYPSERLDQVLVNAAWRACWSVVSAEVVLDQPEEGIWPSDHYGLMLELRARPSLERGGRASG